MFQEIRKLIIKLRSEEKSYKEIAKTIGVGRAVVQITLKNYNNTNTAENKHRSGRPNKLTECEKKIQNCNK